jgi:hypothetical protein
MILPLDPGHRVVHSGVYEEIEIGFEDEIDLFYFGFFDHADKGLFAATPRRAAGSGQCLDEKFFELLDL